MSAESTATENSGNEFTPITSQDDLNKIIGERVKRAKPADYDDLKAKAGQFDELQAEKLTETQRLQQQLDDLTSRSAKSEREAARLSAIADAGIPKEYHALVNGSTPEEFVASAEKAKELIAKANAALSKPGVSYRVNLDGDGSDTLALNGSGIEDALKKKLGIS